MVAGLDGALVAGVVPEFVFEPDEPQADAPATTARPSVTPTTIVRTVRRLSRISIPLSVIQDPPAVSQPQVRTTPADGLKKDKRKTDDR